ncbi:MAG: 50S ribosomal protein L23 [Candidatus Paceibacterota bacterium]
MAFNIFKKQKEEKKQPKKAKKVEEKKEAKPAVLQEPKIEKKVEVPKVRKEKKTDTAYKILKTPHVSEKATDLLESNQYIFRVFEGTNKIEIKRAVEDLYGVKVINVKIINVPEKSRRIGKTTGVRKGYKKAIVKVISGQKIEVLPR